jgi:hypothetical protein
MLAASYLAGASDLRNMHMTTAGLFMTVTLMTGTAAQTIALGSYYQNSTQNGKSF